MNNRMIINLKPGIDLNTISNKSCLLYDASKGYFYTTTIDSLFAEYKRIRDEEVKTLTEKANAMEEGYKKFTEDQKKINEKLISMVEAIVKN